MYNSTLKMKLHECTCTCILLSIVVLTSFREVIEKKPQEFKIGCMRDIRALFPLSSNPFAAGFGNKINDVWAYEEVGVPNNRIFTVNHRGELRLETLSHFSSSYTRLNDIVDMFFPPIYADDVDGGVTGAQGEDGARVTSQTRAMRPKRFENADYSSFQYWRQPLPDVSIDVDALLKDISDGKKK